MSDDTKAMLRVTVEDLETGANPNCPVWEPGEWARRTGQEGRGHGE